MVKTTNQPHVSIFIEIDNDRQVTIVFCRGPISLKRSIDFGRLIVGSGDPDRRQIHRRLMGWMCTRREDDGDLMVIYGDLFREYQCKIL